MSWRLSLSGGRSLEGGAVPRIMGIVNVTPDSFSDGGLWLDPGHAVDHGLRLLAEGADLLDLGAESTRPGGGIYGEGASEVPADAEWQRLEPVIAGLRRASPDAILSIDTRKGEVARRALDAGADLINDVGGLDDPALVDAVAAAGCPVVVMHSRGDIPTMQRGIHFGDVTREVIDELRQRAARGLEAGITPQQIVYDPGIGFGKTTAQNLRLMAGIEHLTDLGPVLVGASRKSFLAAAVAEAEKDRPPPDRRLGGSLAAAAWAAKAGAAILRVHDVVETVQLLRAWNAIDSACHPEHRDGMKTPDATVNGRGESMDG